MAGTKAVVRSWCGGGAVEATAARREGLAAAAPGVEHVRRSERGQALHVHAVLEHAAQRGQVARDRVAHAHAQPGPLAEERGARHAALAHADEHDAGAERLARAAAQQLLVHVRVHRHHVARVDAVRRAAQPPDEGVGALEHGLGAHAVEEDLVRRQPAPLALNEALRPTQPRVRVEREVRREGRRSRLAWDECHISQDRVRLDAKALQLRLAAQLVEQLLAARLKLVAPDVQPGGGRGQQALQRGELSWRVAGRERGPCLVGEALDHERRLLLERWRRGWVLAGVGHGGGEPGRAGDRAGGWRAVLARPPLINSVQQRVSFCSAPYA